MIGRVCQRLAEIGRSIVRSETHAADLAQSLARIETKLDRLAGALEDGNRAVTDIATVMVRDAVLQAMDDPRLADERRLERHGFRVHSQFDEDGIIDEIFRRIGTTSRTFVEFGAGDGSENCTGFLLMQGWRGLWIDGSERFPVFVKAGWPRELERGQLVARNLFITVDTIDDVIREAGFAGEIDFLAVDVDGNDYHFLENIKAVAPRVVCAEYNANIPPHVVWHMERKDDLVWDGLDYRLGASLKALEQLMAGRGYTLVGCSLAGINAFFVRSDLVGDKFAGPFTAENHYHQWRKIYQGAGRGTNWREWVSRR